MAQLKHKILPFGAGCASMEGEVSEETKQWLIETERATEEDFETTEEPKKAKTKTNK